MHAAAMVASSPDLIAALDFKSKIPRDLSLGSLVPRLYKITADLEFNVSLGTRLPVYGPAQLHVCVKPVCVRGTVDRYLLASGTDFAKFLRMSAAVSLMALVSGDSSSCCSEGGSRETTVSVVEQRGGREGGVCTWSGGICLSFARVVGMEGGGGGGPWLQWWV